MAKSQAELKNAYAKKPMMILGFKSKRGLKLYYKMLRAKSYKDISRWLLKLNTKLILARTLNYKGGIFMEEKCIYCKGTGKQIK